MSLLSEQRIDVVKAMLAQAPDSALRDLRSALGGQGGASALSAVRDAVETETWDRTVRDAIFAPLTPLFAPRADGFDQVEFPASALPVLWRSLKKAEPELVEQASRGLGSGAVGDPAPLAFDQLCLAAASGLRGWIGDFSAARAVLDAAAPDGTALLMGYLDITPVARHALRELPGWLSKMTDERRAVLRLAFKDAIALAEDSRPRLLEILFAHLTEPWTVLRVIAAMVNSGADRYASISELADFCERFLVDIDRRLATLRALDLDGGAPAGAAAARAAHFASCQAAEFEAWLAGDRDSPWGRRLFVQKTEIARVAEDILKAADRFLADALPLELARHGKARPGPRLTTLPDARKLREAQAMLSFVQGVRTAALIGGFGSVRNKVSDELRYRLETYLEALLVVIHKGAEGQDVARAFLDAVADCTGLIQDEKAAQIVRRRAAAA